MHGIGESCKNFLIVTLLISGLICITAADATKLVTNRQTRALSNEDYDSTELTAQVIYSHGFKKADIDSIQSAIDRLYKSILDSGNVNLNRLAATIDTSLALILDWSTYSISIVNSTQNVGWAGEAEEKVLLLQTVNSLTVLITEIADHSVKPGPVTVTELEIEPSQITLWGFPGFLHNQIEVILQKNLVQKQRTIQKRALLVAEDLYVMFPQTRFNVLLTSSKTDQFIGFHSSVPIKYGLLATALDLEEEGMKYALVIVGVMQQ